MEKRVAELFAGVGGFRVGLDQLDSGWDFVYANQWEPARKVQYAFQCYCRHFGSDHASNKDINLVDKNAMPDIDLLVGGFPCQDYSVAHSGAMGIEGKKGVLWWDIRDTIQAKTPPFVLLENVDRLLTSPGRRQVGRDFGMILYTLNQLGYGVQWQMINAADYGFPQRRRRVFIFAYRNDTQYANKIAMQAKKSNLRKALGQLGVLTQSFSVKDNLTRMNEARLDGFNDIIDFSDHFSFRFESLGIVQGDDVFTAHYQPDYSGKHETLNDIVLDHVDDASLFLDDAKIKKFEYLKGAKREQRTSHSGFEYYYTEGGMAFPDPLNLPGRTMLTSEHSINRSTHVIRDKETGKLRFLTPIETERMQMFPDNWTEGMPKSSRYFMMGNALVTGIITQIGKRLDILFKSEKKLDKRSYDESISVHH